MLDKELVLIIRKNIVNLHYLGTALRKRADAVSPYTQPKTFALMRLYHAGRAKMKDIAKREYTSVPNLCSLFRQLEADGMIIGQQDTSDARNVYYSVTPQGAKLAEKIMAQFMYDIGKLTSHLTVAEKEKLLNASKVLDERFTELKDRGEF